MLLSESFLSFLEKVKICRSIFLSCHVYLILGLINLLSYRCCQFSPVSIIAFLFISLSLSHFCLFCHPPVDVSVFLFMSLYVSVSVCLSVFCLPMFLFVYFVYTLFFFCRAIHSSTCSFFPVLYFYCSHRAFC